MPIRCKVYNNLSNSFHSSGTNGRLHLSLPRCASCFPTNCPCSSWSGSWIDIHGQHDSPKGVSLLIGGAQRAGCLRGQASPSLRGTQASSNNAQSIIENAVNKASMRTTTPNWCAVLSCGVDQVKSRDAQCLGTCTQSGSSKPSHHLDSGGEFFAQSLEVVTKSERPVQHYPKIRWYRTGWQ